MVELRKKKKHRMNRDDRDHAQVIDTLEDIEAKTRWRDAENRKNHMHRHFGMTGIIRVGGEPPDVLPTEQSERRTTNASALSN